MSNRPQSTTDTTASVESSAATSSDTVAAKARKTLIPLLFIYMLGTLCLQAFNLVFQQVGSDVGAAGQASLITAVPGVVLGIVCFVYGSLCDFASLKRMTMFGLVLLWTGSILGFILHGSLLEIIIFRAIQTAGFQAAGSVYLVIVARYLHAGKKLLYFGMFTAAYQLATAIGVVCGGVFSAIDWSYLFLIPMASLIVVPMLLADLPHTTGRATHVDVPGFIIFALAVLQLTLFFSDLYWPLLAGAIATFVVFAVYIKRARDPFITPEFFRNTRWWKAVALMFLFYFTNFSITPLFNALGANVYGMTSAQVSLVLLPALIIATISGTSSGAIVGRLGRRTTITLGASLMFLGSLSAALCVLAGPVALTACIALFYGGMAMLYSPTVDTVLGTLPAEQSGRGVGMNDLAMQGAGSIGIAIFGTPIATNSLAGGNPVTNLIGASGAASNYTNLLLVYAAVMAVSIIWFRVNSRAIYGDSTADNGK
ncbi:hypothetical protein CS006_05490 [Bifidobacterium primatium]|uniref:Major facilitator superfamily (MFS) profile domain-containing protein n=1 Tax=Bifidobacterium primatium TaxID=2045438 RepID=A0A2M9H9I5_9BIFI|nr:MFS transporter [Bifidobacterium primatium]PJM73488.1 hypothetical protein CS006_05490 [Bifidobacterium primatium]